MARKQIKEYVFTTGIALSENLSPNGYSLISSNKDFIVEEATAFIQYNIDNNIAPFVGYTYNLEKCKRDIKYVLDAYLQDIRYHGNSETRKVAGYYWEGDVPQVDGDRQPEVVTHEFIRDLITDYVLTNTAFTARQQAFAQVIDVSITAEANVSGEVDDLSSIITSVIANGLDSLPALIPAGISKIEMPGKIDIDEILTIINSKSREFLYNFADPQLGGSVEFDYGNNVNFPFITDTENGVTTLFLDINTSGHSNTDPLQIFVDVETVTTRPFDFGTDAIERMRVAPAQSMLDADFEYGLQLTKWQQLDLMRGYPSIYEVPGTELNVDTITTDASTTYGGVGQSLITVTTIGPHGLELNTPITVQGLGSQTIGFSKAEGRFLVNEVTDDTTFSYFAKSKVGTNDGDDLYSSYIALRKGAFYTGASVGFPTFSVVDNGTSGNFTTVLTTDTGQSILTWNGTTPPVGAPLTGGNIATGTQIVSVQGTSGGIVASPVVSQDALDGTNELIIADTTDIVQGMAIDRGDGTSSTIQSIVGNRLTLADNIVGNLSGDFSEFRNLVPAYVGGNGTGASFDVDRTNGVYTVTLAQPDGSTQVTGQDYIVGDRLTILGSSVGGASPENDITLTVGSIGANGELLTFTTAGTAYPRDVVYTAVTGVGVGGGQNASFDVSRSAGTYTINAVNTGGTGYLVGDFIKLSGADLGGLTPANDALLQVSTIGVDGTVTAVSVSGSADPGDENFLSITADPLNGNGSDARFNVEINTGSYIVDLATDPTSTAYAGSNFVVGDRLKIEGQNIGGTSPANDVIIEVTQVSASGEIQDFSFTGTSLSYDARYTNIDPVEGGVGQGATFDVNRAGGSYTSVAINATGTAYQEQDIIILDGNNFGPASQSGTNDITIIVTGVDVNGGITTFTFSGTAWDGSRTYTALNGTQYSVDGSSLSSGNNATWNVSRTGTTYTVTLNTAGTAYAIGDFAIISGVDLDGSSPANDLTITITGVDNTQGEGVGGVTTFTFSGTGDNQDQNYTAIQGTNKKGSGATFDIDVIGSTYSTTLVSAGTGYSVNEVITVNGNSLGGSFPTNDYRITILSVDGSGGILTFNGVGSANPQPRVFLEPNVLLNEGNGVAFTINRSAGVYTTSISSTGTNYAVGNEFVVSGDQLGGVTTANDATITITGVDGLGGVTAVSTSGSGVSGDASYTGISGTNVFGADATFDVTRTNGVYSVVVNAGGTDYTVDETITFAGTLFDGESPANDITVTVDAVDSNGTITGISFSGAGASGNAVYAGLSATPLQGTGYQAFVTRSGGQYYVDTEVDGTSTEIQGTNYVVGDVLKVLGTSLAGTTPANDLEISVTSVGANGEVLDYTFTGTASAGDVVNVYATVSLSEVTVGGVPASSNITYESISRISVDFENAHGLIPGQSILVAIQSTDTNHELAGGPQFIEDVPSPTRIIYTSKATGAIDTSNEDLYGEIYVRPDNFYTHRPFDGGVILGTGGPQYGAQAVRMSKKYIRYQSGKGIMYTTGTMFSPSYDIRSITANDTVIGSTITLTTDDVDHSCQVGAYVVVNGVATPGYNGEYTVNSVVNERTITLISKRILGSTTGSLGEQAQLAVKAWHGTTIRAGAFDEQNGIFFQYDGTTLAIGKRTSTFQIAGTIDIDSDSNLVTGSNTRFLDQLLVGDKIVIRGMTHVVTSINHQTSMTVAPDFRGVNDVRGTKVAKVQELIVPQKDWNLDKCDGTGKSGYIIDTTKMQMIGFQYTWYGAGFIDWMLRGPDGNYVFCHRLKNNNINTEAFMRTGNMPVRYEVENTGPRSRLKGAITNSQTEIEIDDASLFPESGTVYIDNELIDYTSKNTNTLSGATRSAQLNNFAAGAQRTYVAGTAETHIDKSSVILVSNTATPNISHWGSAFLTDGGFDEDRGYIFNYKATGVELSGTKKTAFMVRLAPSVSNSIIGDLGERELINRASLLLQGIEITAGGSSNGIVIEGIINPQNYPLSPGSVQWSGISSLAQGGQPSFAQVASGGGIEWSSGATQTTASATVQPVMNSSLDIYYSTGRRRYTYVTDASWVNSGAVVGDRVSSSQWNSNTTITRADNPFNFGGVQIRYIEFADRANSNLNSGANINIQRGGTYDRTSQLFFTTASWESSGAIIGTELQDSKFPSGTYVNNVVQETFGSTTYYKVTFNQTSNTVINGNDTVTFLFGQPPYALPGETVFSFIAVSGEKNELDLGFLKELTNTPIGGRGSFPNGPDVLAVNVYTTDGQTVNANVLLKWGEAQA